ncbi:MaoC family dehydratase [Pseudenhygromyxa sp. WMMC2535]|uniref:MaoC family dehydratase n=1 Tax=Pseudenhygromyxa sp. WMMC2535 TaxID=2712867 RepID=UPI001552733D|nr:MaoC family dehydratase [Pseudenhygromyxa sp. WMMC2535]NVB40436.1 MaoC family dehydratase [Pseudenhygromyxa sp. WMMC2535]
MALPTKHIRSQGPVLAMLGQTAVEALRRKLTGKAPEGVGPLPGPEIRAELPPRPPELVRDYVRFCGGDPGAYKHQVPAHLWPQWGFPLVGKLIESLPYPIFKVLNGGCRVEVNAPLPIDEPLEVVAQLINIDDNGRRVVLEERVVTSTPSCPDAVVATMYAIVPLGGGDKSKPKGPKPKKTPERVALDATELARWKIPADAGLAFAMLTGDFNPVHWVPPYARAFGFRNTILHGFATMAKAWEGLIRSRYAGDVGGLGSFDVKFTKPLTLPAKVGLYLEAQDAHDKVWVGPAPGGSAYLVGTARAAKPD